MSDVSPLSGISGLSSDYTLLSPLLFFCLVLVLFLSYLFFFFFSACWSILLNFFQKILPRFFVKRQAFLYGPCLAARRSKLVGDMCSMLPYGTGICCYAFIFFFIAFYTLKKSDIDKLTEQSAIPTCPSLMCFFRRGNTEGTDSLKFLCLTFAYVLCQD